MSSILIVDDEKNIVLPLKLYLKSLSHEVFVAHDGIEALDIIDREQIDLIFLDIILPKMSGYLVCEAIRQNPIKKTIPIIFMTAKTEQKDLQKSLDIGGNAYILKPFVMNDILNILKIYL